MTPTPEAIVDEVLDELTGRSGFDGVWDSLERDTKKEIRCALAERVARFVRPVVTIAAAPTWQVMACPFGAQAMQEWLALGWEPFSVTVDDGAVVWLRRLGRREP